MSRDHGGPWQNNLEIKENYNIKDAMKSAKKSFETDILNNFKVIHIDPSLNIDNKNNLKRVTDNIFELYEYCYEFAKKRKKKIIFEIGTEEQTGYSDNFLELENLVKNILIKLDKNNLPKPMFMVAQTGTKVIENRNIGSLDFCPQQCPVPRTGFRFSVGHQWHRSHPVLLFPIFSVRPPTGSTDFQNFERHTIISVTTIRS